MVSIHRTKDDGIREQLTRSHEGIHSSGYRKKTHEGLSLTCRVNVLTLMTSPNSLVMASSCSSGKLGGSPLMYTFGVRKSSEVVDNAGDSLMRDGEEGTETCVGERAVRLIGKDS